MLLGEVFCGIVSLSLGSKIVTSSTYKEDIGLCQYLFNYEVVVVLESPFGGSATCEQRLECFCDRANSTKKQNTELPFNASKSRQVPLSTPF